MNLGKLAPCCPVCGASHKVDEPHNISALIDDARQEIEENRKKYMSSLPFQNSKFLKLVSGVLNAIKH